MYTGLSVTSCDTSIRDKYSFPKRYIKSRLSYPCFMSKGGRHRSFRWESSP